MSEYLVLETTADGRSIVNAGIAADGKWLRAVMPAPGAAEGHEIVAVINGSSVSTHLADVPDFPAGKLLKILPGLMDEQLARAGDANHFSILSARNTDGQCVIGTVDRSIVEAMLETVRPFGGQLSAVVPDYMLFQADTAVSHGDWVIARMASGSGLTIESSLAGHVPDLPDNTAAISDDEWHARLASAPRVSAEGVNLLQGDFAAAGNIWAAFAIFRRAGLLMAFGALLWVGFSLFAGQKNYSRADTYYSEAEELFRAALPETSRIVNMEAQMRQALRSHRQQDGQEFLFLSGVAFDTIEANDNSAIDSLRYDEDAGTLVINIAFSTFGDGEALKRTLQDKGIAVSEGNSRQENSRVYSELTLRRAR